MRLYLPNDDFRCNCLHTCEDYVMGNVAEMTAMTDAILAGLAICGLAATVAMLVMIVIDYRRF